MMLVLCLVVVVEEDLPSNLVFPPEDGVPVSDSFTDLLVVLGLDLRCFRGQYFA